MKYRVVGWTYYDNSEIFNSGNTIGFAERNAIIDEIRKHKYLFTGWHHQESWEGVVPILNDGKKRCFSQRGWGGVMAEAYECMGNYDYASFSFHQSINKSKLNFASKNFNVREFEPEAVLNEHFEVEVNEGLFEIAKKSNPFYLEDEDSLRYIDANDTITLTCNGESLSFVVKEIDRNSAGSKLKNVDKLIKGKYKIIVHHKPESERQVSKASLFVTRSQASMLFEMAIMDEYDYEVIKQVTEAMSLENITDGLRKKSVRNTLTKFIKEYINDNYIPSNVIKILKYISNIDLFEEVAYKTLPKTTSVLVAFIEYGESNSVNMDKHILMYAKTVKPSRSIFWADFDLLYRAIELCPENKSLRKKYYKAINCTRREALSVMAGANLFNCLRVDEKKFIELDKYKNYGSHTIFSIVEYLTYPNMAVFKEAYPYRDSKIYEEENQIMVDGIKAYQQYIKEHFDIDSFMEDMIMVGIDKNCFEMDRYMDGEENAADYICALDMLTNFKYKLKEKALAKYSGIYEKFQAAIDEVYMDVESPNDN